MHPFKINQLLLVSWRRREKFGIALFQHLHIFKNSSIHKTIIPIYLTSSFLNHYRCAPLFLPALYFQSDIWLAVSMCGRFLQSMTREDYLALLADESERDISLNLEPTSQLYSARDIKVQLLNLYGTRLHVSYIKLNNKNNEIHIKPH